MQLYKHAPPESLNKPPVSQCLWVSINIFLLTQIKDQLKIQCNLDYPDLVYPDPRLSGLAGDQKMHYYACAEGVVSDLLWVWSHIE